MSIRISDTDNLEDANLSTPGNARSGGSCPTTITANVLSTNPTHQYIATTTATAAQIPLNSARQPIFLKIPTSSLPGANTTARVIRPVQHTSLDTTSSQVLLTTHVSDPTGLQPAVFQFRALHPNNSNIHMRVAAPISNHNPLLQPQQYRVAKSAHRTKSMSTADGNVIHAVPHRQTITTVPEQPITMTIEPQLIHSHRKIDKSNSLPVYAKQSTNLPTGQTLATLSSVVYQPQFYQMPMQTVAIHQVPNSTLIKTTQQNSQDSNTSEHSLGQMS